MGGTRLLYGRENEQGLVRRLVADAAAGRGQALLVRGDPGIGKTALLDDAVAQVVREYPGALVLRCTGVESEVAVAYGGLLTLLAPVLDRVGALPEPQRAALEGALGMASAAGVGELAVRTGLLTLLHALAADGLVLLAVDDLQWLDPATRSAVLFVARRPTANVAVLLAARDGDPEMDAAVRDLPALGLVGLEPEAARALLGARGVREVETSALLAVAEGNPLALTELPVPDGAPAGPLPLPARLREAFAHRARSLPPGARTLLLVAAAEERGDTDVVLGATARLGVPDPAGAALAAAERAGLLHVTGRTLRFRHPLVRSALYADAPFPDRARAHVAVADTLDTGPGPAARTSARWHRALARTAPDERLAAGLERDADAIAGRGGSAVVASVLVRAAELSTDEEARTRRLTAAAHAAWKSGHPGTARRLVARAAPGRSPELARLHGLIAYSGGDQEGAYRQLVRAAEAHAPHRPEAAAALLFMACDTAEHAGRDDDVRKASLRIAGLPLDERYRAYGRLLADAREGNLSAPDAYDPWTILREAPDDLGTSRVHRWLWPLAVTRDGPDPLRAREFAETACERIGAAGVAALLPRPLLWLADLECRTGRLPEAGGHAEEALRLTRDLDQPVSSADALALLARLAALHGDAPRCRAFAEEASATALPLNNRAAAAEAAWALALLALARGEHAEARDRLLPVHTPGSAHAHRRTARLSAADLTEALVATGDREAARSTAKHAAAWAEHSGLPWAGAQAALCRLLAGEGDAGDDWATADRGCADQPFPRARAALVHGQRLRRERQAAAARERLRHAVDLFDGIGATVWRDRARGELRAAGASARRGREDAVAALTPQELRVARLAAQGLSNREIGARLAMSPRTAGYHLYKIFPKLGLTGRAELRDVEL